LGSAERSAGAEETSVAADELFSTARPDVIAVRPAAGSQVAGAELAAGETPPLARAGTPASAEVPGTSDAASGRDSERRARGPLLLFVSAMVKNLQMMRRESQCAEGTGGR